MIRKVDDLLAGGDSKGAIKTAKQATKADSGNGVVWMQLGKALAASGDVPSATKAFTTAISVQKELSGSEPGARLAVVYDHLSMAEELEAVSSALRKAGLGLDPRVEEEWERMVEDADQKALGKAAGLKTTAGADSTRQANKKAKIRIEKMLAKAGPTTLTGCGQILSIAILHERPIQPQHSAEMIAGVFVDQYKVPGWIPRNLSLRDHTPVEAIHREDAASLQMSESNAILAESMARFGEGVNLDSCAAISFSGDNPALGHTFFSILAK